MTHVYIIEVFGKDSLTDEQIVLRHPNAFTRHEDAKAEKGPFLESVRGSFDPYHDIYATIIAFEVK